MISDEIANVLERASLEMPLPKKEEPIIEATLDKSRKSNLSHTSLKMEDVSVEGGKKSPEKDEIKPVVVNKHFMSGPIGTVAESNEESDASERNRVLFDRPPIDPRSQNIVSSMQISDQKLDPPSERRERS